MNANAKKSKWTTHRLEPAFAAAGARPRGAQRAVSLCAAPSPAAVQADPLVGADRAWTRNGATERHDTAATNQVASPTTLSLTKSAPIDTTRVLTLLTSLLTIGLTVRYVVWRVAINNWHNWWLSIPLLGAEMFTALHILGYQYTIWPRKEPDLAITDNATDAPIFVFIPTVNEGREILEPTVKGALIARDRFIEQHPNADIKVVVCNDGLVAKTPDWQTPIDLAAEYGIECLTREVKGGAKAGNIENARNVYGANGDALIIVLDADQVAAPDFLLKTVPYFGDPTVGWVQTRQYYRNQDSTIARWAESQATLFYDHVCPGKATLNASYICGTNVVIRAKVLDEIGGFPQESITEDFAASVRTHQSWRSVYLKDVLAQGLGPMDLTGYYVQQGRWARGTIGVMMSDWKRLLMPSRTGLGFGQRVQYFLSGSHYLCGIRDATFLACALICLAVSVSPVKAVSATTIALYLLPYIVASQLVILLQTRTPSVLGGVLMGYSSFPTLVVSLLEAVTNRRIPFRVTPKSKSGQSDLRVIVPHIVIAIACIAIIVRAVATHTAWTPGHAIPLLWAIYAVCMLVPTFALARVSKTHPA